MTKERGEPEHGRAEHPELWRANRDRRQDQAAIGEEDALDRPPRRARGRQAPASARTRTAAEAAAECRAGLRHRRRRTATAASSPTAARCRSACPIWSQARCRSRRRAGCWRRRRRRPRGSCLSDCRRAGCRRSACPASRPRKAKPVVMRRAERLVTVLDQRKTMMATAMPTTSTCQNRPFNSFGPSAPKSGGAAAAWVI